jgi:hypothetical protein
MDCLGDAEVILFGLEGHFFGQKEWFKTILGPDSGLFCCYYEWLPWPDPERTPSDERRRNLTMNYVFT